MPDFEIHGKGIKTGRKRKRTYTANSIEEAKAMALKDDTDPVEVIELSSKPAPKATSKPAVKKKTAATKKSATTGTATKKATTKKSTAPKSTKPAVAPLAAKKVTNKKKETVKKPVTIARVEVNNSPHWTRLPKSKIRKSTNSSDSSKSYLLLMVAFLLFIMFYYFGMI